jgi:hypothetical protein
MQIASIEMLDDEMLALRAVKTYENRWLRKRLKKEDTTSGFFFFRNRTAPATRQLSTANSNRKKTFTLSLGTHIVGILSVDCAPNAPKVLVVSDMAVEQNQVWEPFHAQALLESAFQYATAQEMTVSPVNLTAKGKSVIQSALTELTQKYSQNSASVRN